MSEKLLPCPYVIAGPWTDDDGQTFIEIQRVGGHELIAQIYADKAEAARLMAEQAITAWNTRASMQADTDLERIKQERDQAVEALRPFAEYGKWAVDENGWNLGSPRERLCDWFGPSDFHRAATTLASIEGAGDE